jgi:hypothetical protein
MPVKGGTGSAKRWLINDNHLAIGTLAAYTACHLLAEAFFMD